VAVQRGDLDLKKDKKARELAIADNRVGELDLEWNPEVLASLEVDLKQFWNENELNALLKDFRISELSSPEPKIDQAAELQQKWKTKRGQIWEIAAHRLMCGDSASISDVAALMDGKTAKLCATDPPYLVSYDAKNHPSKNFSDGKNNLTSDRGKKRRTGLSCALSTVPAIGQTSSRNRTCLFRLWNAIPQDW
jgi:hypothetical protein